MSLSLCYVSPVFVPLEMPRTCKQARRESKIIHYGGIALEYAYVDPSCSFISALPLCIVLNFALGFKIRNLLSCRLPAWWAPLRLR